MNGICVQVAFAMVLCFGSAESVCPKFSDFPKTDRGLTYFYGARVYRGKGGSISTLACNGGHWTLKSGYKWSSSSDRWCVSVGSLFVFPGCTFYEFEHHGYRGRYTPHRGSLSLFQGPQKPFTTTGAHRIPCVRSFIVECGMKMPRCAPKENWRTVAVLDNSGSSIPTTFTYYYYIGTEWSNEISQGFNIDLSVTISAKSSFFGLFKGGVSTTLSTGYNWQHTSSEAKSAQTSYTIETEIPAGAKSKIEQVQGVCGDSTVYTEMFRHTDEKTGKMRVYRV